MQKKHKSVVRSTLNQKYLINFVRNYILIAKSKRMANSNQIKNLIRSHYNDSNDSFSTIALQIAASEAKVGHRKFAEEIRNLVDGAKLSHRKPAIIAPDLRGLFLERIPIESLSDLIASDDVCRRIERILAEYVNKDKLFRNNLENRRKILFTGPAGTGKTMSASIIANELNLPLYIVLSEKLVTKYMGETSARLRQIFDFIELQPAVYLFDEFDAIGSQRGKENEVGEMRRVLNSFLQFIERDHSESLIIAATNDVEILDNALFRRFDDVISYELPNKTEILKLLQSKTHGFFKDQELLPLIEQMKGLSHAEITRACLDAIKSSVLTDEPLNVNQISSAIKERQSVYKR